MGARGSFKGSFAPQRVPEVAAGYFWDPAQASGSASASFLIPEGNGKSAYNIITPSAGVAPAIGLVNGQAVITYANGTPDKCGRVSGTVQRGFTGASMIWGWVSAAAAPGVVLGHFRTSQNFALQLNTSDCRLYVNDGGGVIDARFPNPTYANGPFYYEGVFDPSQATATNRMQIWVNRVQLTPNVAGSPGTSMLDTADVLGFSASANDSSNFNINADFSAGVMGMTSGIPSDDNRDRLFNYRRLA